ncbi:MAG TPA: DUF4136 domain-containing protein [Blastocatellia bacterium]|nr:DUF4136 domain-containing protein [Blastocatellia bacterium]
MRIISCFCLLFVAPYVALGQKVSVDWERGASFQRYTTYAWGECEDLGELRLWQPRIVQDIEFQLAVRGFRKAAPGQQPDVIISYQTDVEERASFVESDYGYGPGWGPGPALGWGPSWGWGWNGGPVTVEPVVERKFELTVEIVDARRNQLLWHGDATDTLSHKSEKNVKRLRRAVEKLFRNYPYGD